MTQEPPGTSCVLPFSAMKPAFTAWNRRAIGVPQNVAVRQITAEIRFDDIAGCELLVASLRIEATFTPRAQRSLPNNAFALPLAICAAIFGGNCVSQAR
jgi:hypothetical protein